MSKPRVVKANGIDIFVVEEGAGPLALLCHGWPELSWSWRHQIPALAAAGFHVVAPDMRGFGKTTVPQDVNAYSIVHNTGDMIALVGALGEQKAIIIGHDWGAPVAWHCAMFRPDIFTAVAGLSVPPFGRGPAPPLQMLASQGINNFYIQYFQTPGVAEAEFERDVEYTFRSAFAASPGGMSMFLKEGFGFLGDPAIERKLAPWISVDEVAVFVENYRRTGFRGGLSWYRNLDRNWELTAPWQGAQIRQPSLFLAGSRDGVITGPMGQRRLAEMDKVVTDLRGRIIIDGAGHWIQQERPKEVNEALINFCRLVTQR